MRPTLCTRARPNVALNRCLPCFLINNANQGYTYIKLYQVNERGEDIHWFLDPFSLIHYTHSTSREAQQSTYYTLLYWEFPVPTTWVDGGKEKPVNNYHWSIFGNPKRDQVLVIHNTIDYGADRSFDFLSYRDGKPSRLTASAGKVAGYSWPRKSGLRRRMTDTATMWRVTPSFRWRATGCGTWWHRSPAKKTTGKKEQQPHETLDRGAEKAASSTLLPGT